MFFGGPRTAAAPAARQSALDELLATERDIAAQAAAAEREASEVIARARGDAEAIGRDAATALAAEVAELEKREETARTGLRKQLEDEAARLVARYGSLGDAEIARLARFVVSELTGLAPASGG